MSIQCADVARGLDFLHRREIVHGAVRPVSRRSYPRPEQLC